MSKKPTEYNCWEYMELMPQTFGLVDPRGKFYKEKFDSIDLLKAFIDERNNEKMRDSITKELVSNLKVVSKFINASVVQ